jgi:hypothetical protein
MQTWQGNGINTKLLLFCGGGGELLKINTLKELLATILIYWFFVTGCPNGHPYVIGDVSIIVE